MQSRGGVPWLQRWEVPPAAEVGFPWLQRWGPLAAEAPGEVAAEPWSAEDEGTSRPPGKKVLNTLLLVTYSQCTGHTRTPHAHPLFCFSPCVSILYFLYCLTSLQHPSLPGAHICWVLPLPVPQCLDERRPQLDWVCLSLDSSPVNSDSLDSSCLADFAHYAIWLWISHSRCCFRLRSAPILCLSVPQCCALWGLPRLGLVRMCSQERASPWALGFRALNWLLRQRVAPVRVGWRPCSAEALLFLFLFWLEGMSLLSEDTHYGT